MRNKLLKTHYLRTIIFGLLFVLPFLGFSQSISNSKILPRQQFNHLTNSPSTLNCDSLGLFWVVFTSYTNKMPMADNSKLIWQCWIGQGDRQGMEHLSVCFKLEIKKIYLFYEKEVYIYTYGTTLEKESKKIYSVPLVAVIEYYDKTAKKKGYIKTSKNSFINYGSVE